MRKLTVSGLLAILVLTLSACGGEDPSSAQGGEDDDAARIAFAGCMRDHGIQVADPSSAGNGPTRITSTGRMTPEKLEAAEKECRRKFPDGAPKPPSQAEQQEFQDAAFKFSACMRSKGVNMPDPKVDGGRITMAIRKGTPGFDPRSPRFQAAQKACQKLMPGGGPRRGSNPDEIRVP